MIDIATQSIHPLLAFGLALGISALGIFILLHLPKKQLVWDLPDRPNAMHTSPTPRMGGLIMTAAVALTLVVFSTGGLPKVLIMTAAILMLVSLCDDRWQLSPGLRLATHLAAATLVTLFWVRNFVFSSPADSTWVWLSSPLGIVIGILAITWMTNLYNFMDGADGLAGGMAAFGFGSYALVAYNIQTQDAAGMALLSAALAGASVGFLVFNFPAAKIFMGDAGSIPLGFLAAVLGIHGIFIGIWRWWFPIIVFSPFIVDASITLIKRIGAHKKIWHAHREHYYHRLILGGWSHRRTAVIYYLIMFSASLSAFIAQTSAPVNSQEIIDGAILVTWVVIYALLLCLSEWRFVNNKNEK